MKLKIIFSLLVSMAISLFVGVVTASVLPVNPLAAGTVFFVAKTLYFSNVTWKMSGTLLAGINKEIWIDKLKENFYSPYPWLDGVDDWSEWVEFNTINFTTIGTDPVILKNNAAWPIVAAQRTDTNSTVVMDTYDSTTTRVRNVEEIESAINKLESVVKQHRQKLLQDIVTECLWNYSPASNATGTPVFAATGANRAVVIGSQSTVASTLTLQDIASLQEKWDALDFPQDGRVLVLSPYHRADLMKQDITLFKSFMDLKNGQALPLFGFDVYVAANAPLYTKTTLVKKTFGAAADNVNDCVASSAFIKTEMMKAMGDIEVFYREKGTNPEQRADEIGYQMRFKGVPQRSAQCTAAIISNRA